MDRKLQREMKAWERLSVEALALVDRGLERAGRKARKAAKKRRHRP